MKSCMCASLVSASRLGNLHAATATRISTLTMKSNNSNNYVGLLALSCFIGLLLSVYAVYVELNIEKDSGYAALCDISEKISCTKVFSSRYGKGFGLLSLVFGDDSFLNQPNGITGICYYIILLLLGFINNPIAVKIQLILCVLSNLMSAYLAYLLYFVLEDLCIVCVGTYVVNLVAMLATWKRHRMVQNEIALNRSRSKFD